MGIFMDCNMPVMDGFEASSILTNMMNMNEMPTIQIVACTAHALDEDINKCKQHGMTLFLKKPIEFPKLEKILSKMNLCILFCIDR